MSAQLPTRLLHFRMSGSLHFGVGAIERLPDLFRAHPQARVLVVTDRGLVAAGVVGGVTRRLEEHHVPFEVFDGVEPDPSVAVVLRCTEAARQWGATLLLGLGGGSSIDVAKVAAVLLTNAGGPLDFAGIGLIPLPGLPVIAIPTTAGTGSEVTPIAVLSDKDAQLKKGLVSDHLYPTAAIVDPALAVGLPPRITAYTGMDALTHCIEAFTNKFAHPFIDVFAEQGIKLLAGGLRRAYCQGSDLAARHDAALGSLYGGLCLGSVNTAAVHALAYPLGGTYDIPHGLANTLLLPHVLAFNVPADLRKHALIAQWLGRPVEGSSARAAAEGAVGAVRELAVDLGMDLRLRDFDIPENAIPTMAEAAMKVTRLLNNNPRTVTQRDCEAIYRAAW
jgi:alcohol dehydrogenase class IV